MLIISNRSHTTRSADYSLNCTPLSPITITNFSLKMFFHIFFNQKFSTGISLRNDMLSLVGNKSLFSQLAWDSAKRILDFCLFCTAMLTSHCQDIGS